MKAILTILIAFFLQFGLLIAQVEDLEKEYSLRHDIGFNVSQVFANIFTENDVLDEAEDLSFIYKYHVSSKGAVRLGISGRIINNEQSINNTDLRINSLERGIFRIGYEFRKTLNTKWTTLFGIDGIYGFENNETSFDSNFDVVTTSTRRNRYAASPFFGIEFQINKHIRLSTELSFSYNIIDNIQEDNFTNFPEFNQKLTNTDTEYRIESPTFIYLTVRL